jgi:hypothetical protein
MKKLILLFIFVTLQFQSGWAQSLDQKILGKWEVLDYDLSEENVGEQEKPSGIIWTFYNNICEERIDPSNPTDVTKYEYKISQNTCETGTISSEFYYITLINKTVPGDDYCFMIEIDRIKETNQEILRLYAPDAIQPNILVRK